MTPNGKELAFYEHKKTIKKTPIRIITAKTEVMIDFLFSSLFLFSLLLLSLLF